MPVAIHPTAVVDPDAELGSSVSVGPYAVIGAEVVVGDDCEIGSAAQLQGPCILGSGNRIFPHACVGLDPQDLKYQGERTTLEVGDGNTFREFCTVNRGTGLGGGSTTIGNQNLLMAYSHVAHDCHIANRAILTNAATLAGHVIVEDYAAIGAFSAVQQFCRVGRHAYIGGYSIITKDALPYMKTVGAKPACIGVNRIGLQRRGFDEARIKPIEAAARVLLRSSLNTSQALEQLKSEFAGNPDIELLIEYLESSELGVIKALPGQRSARGSGG
ncbi:MAG: acyl-ACP--UDP-N-acetylglucosamine O-acyltransferase [bacterium]|nr:acyl-ACP--UDP-N-acetylglucosamine O-acyltransferase [bacterium]